MFTEVGIYKKTRSKKTRKHVFEQESDQEEKKKKKRKLALDQNRLPSCFLLQILTSVLCVPS